MHHDLPSFLRLVEERHPQWLLRVAEPIDISRYEATALLQHLDNRADNRIVLFENVRNLRGEPSAFPLVFNVFATRGLCALAVGMEPARWQMELGQEFARREKISGPVTIVPKSGAPCKEVVLKGDEADLRIFPMPMHHALDAGPFFTMTCLMKALSGDFYDITFTKNQFYGPRRMSISAHAHHHLDTIVHEYEAENKRAPVAVVLGHHPAFYLSTCCMTPYGNDDYRTAAAFLEGGLRLTPSETWGEAFLVPADAEIVIEGEIPPKVREKQNPFGEIARYYQEEVMMPLVEVTAITHRRGAIMQGVFPGHAEHWNLGGIPKEGSVYNAIKKNVPGVKAVHLPMSGCGRFACYISLKKEFPNEPRKAAMQAFVEMPNLKFCVVVDDDVDVFNEQDVLWALATRTWWDQDLEVIDHVQSFRGWLGHAVAIVDATRPLDRPFPVVNSIPEEAMARIDLERYLRVPAAR